MKYIYIHILSIALFILMIVSSCFSFLRVLFYSFVVSDVVTGVSFIFGLVTLKFDAISYWFTGKI